MTNLPKKFCMAPFVHMYVHSNEAERVCCMSTEETMVSSTTELDLSKRWTSEHLKKYKKTVFN